MNKILIALKKHFTTAHIVSYMYKYIYDHKRRDHSDFMLLCYRCEYMTNDNSHLKRHFRRKHPEYML